MSLPKAILLDQDGTIIDSEPLWENAERAMTEALGGVLTAEMRQRMIGGPLRETIDLILEASGAERDPAELEDELVTEVAGLIGADGVPWMPGVPEFFARVGEAGVPLGLVTSSRRRICDVVVPAAPEPGFAKIVSGDDVARLKPAPDAYLEGARRFGVDIADCLVVEDSPTGIRAAVDSGAVVVVIPGVADVPASPDYSRLKSLDDLTLERIEALMAGERLDLV